MPSLRFCLITLVALLAVVPAAAAAPARVAEILERHRLHGYASPLVAARELMAATDRPTDTAPLAERERYYAALAGYGVKAGRREIGDAALAKLDRMAAEEGCVTCGYRSRLRQARAAASRREIDKVRALLGEARSLLASPPPHLQLELDATQAMLHLMADEHGRAIEMALEAADRAERLGFPAEQVALLGLVMKANISRGDLERALEVSHEIYALAERIGYTFEMALTRTNQGYVYGGKEENYPKFHAALKDALRLAQGVPGMEDFVLTTLINLSAYHIYVHEYPQSIAVTHRAEKLAIEIGDELSRAFAISNRGSAMARMGQVEAGLALMQKASEAADRAGDKRASVDLLNEKVNVYELVGRHADALKTLREVVKLDKALTGSEREKAVLELQAKFSAERKTREIERLSSENARRLAEVEARTWQQRLWAAVAVALAFGAILLWLGLRHVRRRNRALEVDNATLSEQSSHDPLTGVFNRRHCERLMGQQEITLNGRSHDREYKATVGLVLLDVDFFKKVNDTHGHAAGDAVLVAVAKRLQELVREKDAVVRWGGEEFVLVLPGTPAEGLTVVVRRVLDAIGRTPVEVGGVSIPVTASAGCVAWPAFPGQHWEDALHVADLALYLSKASGRNRATCLMQVGDDARMDRMRHDLAAAEAAGDVVLQTILGPGGAPAYLGHGEASVPAEAVAGHPA